MPALTKQNLQHRSNEHLLKMMVLNLQFANVFELDFFRDKAMQDYKTCEAEVLARMGSK